MASSPGEAVSHPLGLHLGTPVGVARRARARYLEGADTELEEGEILSSERHPATNPNSSRPGSVGDNIISGQAPAGLDSSIHASETHVYNRVGGVVADAANQQQSRLLIVQDFCRAFDEVAEKLTTEFERQTVEAIAEVFTTVCTAFIENPGYDTHQQTYTPINIGSNVERSSNPRPTQAKATFADKLHQGITSHKNVHTGERKDPQRPSRTTAPPPDKDLDNRIFVRLDDQSSFVDKDPAAVRMVIANQIDKSSTDITAVTRVRTGWAIRPRNDQIRELILKNKNL
ncbi:hypothetical protein FAUST_11378, partial [Fusarium austroamericanum]